MTAIASHYREKLEINITEEMKRRIAEGVYSEKEMKEEYRILRLGRKIPELQGHHDRAPHNFAMFQPGIALIASLLCKKNNISNLWVCESTQSFQNKLREISNSPENQRHALVMFTHDSEFSSRHPKMEDWTQHKLALCIEKVNGHMHIYMLEVIPKKWNGINESNINLNEDLPFTLSELLLARIDAIGLDERNTTIYSPLVRREQAVGCTTFALRDSVFFLRDLQFTQKLQIAPGIRLRLPQSQIALKTIEFLPPECMQLTQDVKVVKQYQTDCPVLALQSFGPPHRQTTLAESLKKHVFIIKDSHGNDKERNLYIVRRQLKYQAIILEALRQKSDEEINRLINSTFLKTSSIGKNRLLWSKL